MILNPSLLLRPRHSAFGGGNSLFLRLVESRRTLLGVALSHSLVENKCELSRLSRFTHQNPSATSARPHVHIPYAEGTRGSKLSTQSQPELKQTILVGRGLCPVLKPGKTRICTVSRVKILRTSKYKLSTCHPRADGNERGYSFVTSGIPSLDSFLHANSMK